jgi:hypothetical protein
MKILTTWFFVCVLWVLPTIASAQFVDNFEAAKITADPAAQKGWASFAGDGKATISFQRGGKGYASIDVDATRDRRGIWWAVIKRKVSGQMDLQLLQDPNYELRIEARIRLSHAPRRVNLSLNTQRTTDFHTNLMEFDIPDTDTWHTISFTTREFPAVPGDTVYGQLALIDWGLERYRVDVDYFKVDLIDVRHAGPDQGTQVPYHPPVADSASFRNSAPVMHDAIIDLENPEVNLNNWQVRDAAGSKQVLTVGGRQYAILRFDLAAYAGRRVAGSGLLELTTHSLQRSSDEIKDFGQIRVVEILGGDPAWDQRTVTIESFGAGQSLERVLNGQMIIDWPVNETPGGKTRLTIPGVVLQRLLDGRTQGIAIKPLGSINASFYALEQDKGKQSARLLFNLEPEKR